MSTTPTKRIVIELTDDQMEQMGELIQGLQEGGACMGQVYGPDMTVVVLSPEQATAIRQALGTDSTIPFCNSAAAAEEAIKQHRRLQ